MKGPALLNAYLPKPINGPGERIEAEVVRKQRDGNRLLVKITTPQGPALVTFTRKVSQMASPPLNSTTRYRWRNLEAFLSVENLTNVQWREAQFAFTSRRPGEPAGGVNDVHFTPGAPRSFLGGVAAHF